MKIGIDARLYFQTGVGTYLRNFLSNLQRVSPPNFLFYIYILKKNSDRIIFTNKNFIKRETTAYWHTFKEQWDFLKLLYRDNLDLIHFTYFSYPAFYRRKFIATVHDLTPFLFKTGKAATNNLLLYQIKYLGYKFVLSNQIKNAVRLITPSLTVKKQLKKIFGEKINGKTEVIYEGVDENLMKANENKSLKLRFKKSFFLYVGNFYPHKNVKRLIMAFSGINDDNKKLILTGPRDYFSEKTEELVNKLKLGKRIIFYYQPSFDDLVFFYKNAQALIHPSFSEGFGLPLIEAAYFGCPIIASDIPVFKEILGNQFLSFNPYDIEDIRKKINLFLAGRRKFDYTSLLKKYSFLQMTRKTIKIYQQQLKK